MTVIIAAINVAGLCVLCGGLERKKTKRKQQRGAKINGKFRPPRRSTLINF
jgi:Ca2+/H+ antiporter